MPAAWPANFVAARARRIPAARRPRSSASARPGRPRFDLLSRRWPRRLSPLQLYRSVGSRPAGTGADQVRRSPQRLSSWRKARLGRTWLRQPPAAPRAYRRRASGGARPEDPGAKPRSPADRVPDRVVMDADGHHRLVARIHGPARSSVDDRDQPFGRSSVPAELERLPRRSRRRNPLQLC